MPTLPAEYLNILAVFAPLFSNCVWTHVQVLVVGAMLTPGQRTVTAILRIMGLSHERHFQTYHRVLNRAIWSCWEVSRVLLQMLVGTFAASGPVIVGIDDTIERRWGAKIKDVEVIAAAKAAGLVDNKVVGFSETHTALRLVIPVNQR